MPSSDLSREVIAFGFGIQKQTQSKFLLQSRLCVKGCSQKYGIDYVETFSPVARYETIRTLLAVAANKNLILKQFDFGTAFLNGELEKEIYMHQPDGFSDGTPRVCKLDKNLYRLKQAPRAWNSTFYRFLQSFGLVRSFSDPCLYTNSTLTLAIYADDGLIAAQSGGEAEKLIHAMEQRFDVKVTDAQFYVGMQIERNHQPKPHIPVWSVCAAHFSVLYERSVCIGTCFHNTVPFAPLSGN